MKGPTAAPFFFTRFPFPLSLFSFPLLSLTDTARRPRPRLNRRRPRRYRLVPDSIAAAPDDIVSSPRPIAATPEDIVSSPRPIAAAPDEIASSPRPFGDEKGEEKLPCCISHEFLHAASKNPSLIAVVHAATTGRHLPDASSPSGLDEDAGSTHVSSSSSPPVYPGDECFTYADILSAVDSLSRRLRRVLDGGDDPNPPRRR